MDSITKLSIQLHDDLFSHKPVSPLIIRRYFLIKQFNHLKVQALYLTIHFYNLLLFSIAKF